MPTLDEDSPEASSATAKASAAPPPTSWPSPACAASIESRAGRPVCRNTEAATNSMDRLISPATPSADEHVEPLEAQQLAALAVVRGRSPGDLVSAECR